MYVFPIPLEKHRRLHLLKYGKPPLERFPSDHSKEGPSNVGQSWSCWAISWAGGETHEASTIAKLPRCWYNLQSMGSCQLGDLPSVHSSDLGFPCFSHHDERRASDSYDVIIPKIEVSRMRMRICELFLREHCCPKKGTAMPGFEPSTFELVD